MGDRLGIRGAVFILPLQAKTVVKKADEPVSCSYYPILDSLVVRIPACHAGGRGSIPRQGEFFYFMSIFGNFGDFCHQVKQTTAARVAQSVER